MTLTPVKASTNLQARASLPGRQRKHISGTTGAVAIFSFVSRTPHLSSDIAPNHGMHLYERLVVGLVAEAPGD